MAVRLHCDRAWPGRSAVAHSPSVPLVSFDLSSTLQAVQERVDLRSVHFKSRSDFLGFQPGVRSNKFKHLICVRHDRLTPLDRIRIDIVDCDLCLRYREQHDIIASAKGARASQNNSDDSHDLDTSELPQ